MRKKMIIKTLLLRSRTCVFHTKFSVFAFWSKRHAIFTRWLSSPTAVANDSLSCCRDVTDGQDTRHLRSPIENQKFFQGCHTFGAPFWCLSYFLTDLRSSQFSSVIELAFDNFHISFRFPLEIMMSSCRSSSVQERRLWFELLVNWPLGKL